MTAPNGEAQRRLIIAVQAALENKTNVTALEMHGTGTTLGDPVEVCAVVGGLCKSKTEVLCTSLKANIGHLEAAASGVGAVA